MNDAIESVMSFINENTNTLIIICIFLIIILVIYLIENSIKSSRIKKNIKEEKEIIENTLDDTPVTVETSQFEQAVLEENTPITEEEIIRDKETKEEPVKNIFMKEEENKDNNVEVLYKNDKKLSEILFDNIESQPEGKIDESLVKNNPEKENPSDELDSIIRKLNNMENNIEEDNYTNIF